MTDAGAAEDVRSIDRDYRREFARVRRFFPGGDPRNVTVVLPDQVPTGHAYLGEETVAALRAHNEAAGCGELTLGNIDLLSHDDVRLIVATHAPCFLTGPLQVIYKALTCVQLAAYCRETLGMRVVPLFWLASDTTQTPEARTVRLVNAQDQVVALSYEPDGLDATGRVGATPLEDQADFLLRLLGADTGYADFKRGLLELLLETRTNSASLGEWTARLLHALFRFHGLVVLDETQPFVTAQMVRCLAEPCAWGSRPGRLVREMAEELTAEGYGGALEVPADVAPFEFRSEDGLERWTVDGQLFTSATGTTVSADGMRDQLAARHAQVHIAPWIRPLLQCSWLPIAACVVDPDEIRTGAHLTKLFEVATLSMPLFFPRARVVLVEASIHQLMQKYGVALADFVHPRTVLTERTLAKNEIPRPVIESCDRKLSVLQAVLDELRDEVKGSNPELTEQVDSLKRQLGRGLEDLRRELIEARTESPQIVTANLERIRAHVFPEGKPQERMLNVFPFLFVHGLELLSRIAADMDIFDFDVQTVRL